MEKADADLKRMSSTIQSKSSAGDSRATVVPHEILLSLVDHLDAMLAYWDVNQICIFANDAYREWFGKTREQMLGHTLSELLGPLYPKNLPYIQAAYAGHKQVFEREIRTPDGRLRHSLATYTPYTVDGAVRGIFVHVADVTRLKLLEHELKTEKAKAELLATHDFLTGLPNRVLWQDRITQALALANRQNDMLAVLSVDIDDFKKVNDTYGHSEGDRLLVEIGSRIKATLRNVDTVARFGGDELLVLIPGIDSQSQVEVVADRLLAAAGRPVTLGSETMAPACSLGIALYPRDGTTPEELMVNSDRALYAAKKRGKGCYAFFAKEGH
ncbi:MAG TPA: GGDEF domain-containing protein [Steroidobacteraceae bacterium]|nr:GGDEF domain-containing protein [Steroidobacteraceae bacterium]